MGQNFLVNQGALNKIIEAAELTAKDIILEVGPGIGTLTKELAKRAGKVITVEKDKLMIEILKETLKDYKNIETINDNILKFNPKSYNLKAKSYKLVANIPYYLTSPLIRKFLESKNPPDKIILMIQKEVAQRICARPPSPPHQSSKRTSGVGARMSLLAVSVQFYAKPKIISYISKKCFWPAPKIDSAIIKISDIKNLKIDAKKFFKIVKAGFSQPRKQLANNLSGSLKIDKIQVNAWLLKNKINPKQRAETLSVLDWEKLANSQSINI